MHTLCRQNTFILFAKLFHSSAQAFRAFHSTDFAAMTIDVYWQQGRHRLFLGSISVDDSFRELLQQAHQELGIFINPCATTKLYPSQWKQLLLLARSRKELLSKLQAIQAKYPPHTSEGFVMLEGE